MKTDLLFRRIANPDDLEAIFELDALTNPRLRDELGATSLVHPEERIRGPGATVIMAAFTHLNPNGNRFSDGSYGVLYAADSLDTGIAETKYHREQFLMATAQGRMELDMRVYLIDLEGYLHDLRGRKTSRPRGCFNDDYTASQAPAGKLRETGSDGIVYDSVRQTEGECAAVFRPSLLSNVRQEWHLCYVWNGSEIVMVYEKRTLDDRTS